MKSDLTIIIETIEKCPYEFGDRLIENASGNIVKITGLYYNGKSKVLYFKVFGDSVFSGYTLSQLQSNFTLDRD